MKKFALSAVALAALFGARYVFSVRAPAGAMA